jgi:hypothetical protein
MRYGPSRCPASAHPDAAGQTPANRMCSTFHEPGRPKTGRTSPAPAVAHGRGCCERDGHALLSTGASSPARRRLGAAGARAGCRLGVPRSRLCERQRLHGDVSQGARQDHARLFHSFNQLNHDTFAYISIRFRWPSTNSGQIRSAPPPANRATPSYRMASPSIADFYNSPAQAVAAGPRAKARQSPLMALQ